MKLFSDKDTALLIAATFALGLIASAICLLFDARAAAVCAALTVSAAAAEAVFSARRAKRAAKLSASIERLLAGERDVDISEYAEGELSILKNELEKLSSLIGQQETVLKNDKRLLADSIADISHQIRTPLTSANLLLASVSSPETGEEKRAEALCELQRQLSRIDRLVTALLKLARLDAGAVRMEQKTVELSALIRDALSPVAIQMELCGQTAAIEAEGSVFCDPSWTAEAVSNVIKNCSEHMGEGEIEICAHENPLYSEIVIRDHGPGIAEEDLPRIFERFYKGKDSSGAGFGIGLALMRAIVLKQNGTVKAENAHDGGARFTIRLYKGAV